MASGYFSSIRIQNIILFYFSELRTNIHVDLHVKSKFIPHNCILRSTLETIEPLYESYSDIKVEYSAEIFFLTLLFIFIF